MQSSCQWKLIILWAWNLIRLISFFPSTELCCYLFSFCLRKENVGRKEPIFLFSSVSLGPGGRVFWCSRQSWDVLLLSRHFSTWSFAGKHEIILFELWAYVHPCYASLDRALCWAQIDIFCLSAGALAWARHCKCSNMASSSRLSYIQLAQILSIKTCILPAKSYVDILWYSFTLSLVWCLLESVIVFILQ